MPDLVGDPRQTLKPGRPKAAAEPWKGGKALLRPSFLSKEKQLGV